MSHINEIKVRGREIANETGERPINSLIHSWPPDVGNIDYADYPDVEYRRDFISRYLLYRNRVQGHNDDVTQEHIDKMLKHTDIAHLVS